MDKLLLTVSIFDCNINTAIFNSWVEQDLIPKLPNNSVVVTDNASFHKSPHLKTMIEKAGHILEYLPPYSPDLNPIEPKWAQAKSRRRKYHCDLNTRECSSNCVILKIISQISVYLENKYPAEKLPKPNLISAYSI